MKTFTVIKFKLNTSYCKQITTGSFSEFLSFLSHKEHTIKGPTKSTRMPLLFLKFNSENKYNLLRLGDAMN